MYTINLKYDEINPESHLQALRGRISEIKKQYTSKGKELHIIFVGHSTAVPAGDCSRGEKFTPFVKFEPNSDGLRVLDTSGKGNFTEALDKVLSGEPSAGTTGAA